MAELGGLWNRLPLLAFFLILSSLGSAAVPGLNGFVGEFPILAGMFDRSPRAAVLAATGHDPRRVLPALDAPARRLRPAPRAARRMATVTDHGARTTAPRADPPGRLARDRRPDAADGPDRRDRRLSAAVPRPDPAVGRARSPRRSATSATWRRIAAEADRVAADSPAGQRPRAAPRAAPGRRRARHAASRRPEGRRAGPAEARPPRRTKRSDHALEPRTKSARQTLLILLPELLILLTATVMMTAGAFVRLPRRAWCASAVGGDAGGALRRPAARSRDQDDRPVLGGGPQRRLLVLRRGWSSCSPG